MQCDVPLVDNYSYLGNLIRIRFVNFNGWMVWSIEYDIDFLWRPGRIHSKDTEKLLKLTFEIGKDTYERFEIKCRN